MTLWTLSIGVIAALLIGAVLPGVSERIVTYKCRQRNEDKPPLSKAFYRNAIFLSSFLCAVGFFASFYVTNRTLDSIELVLILLTAIVFAYIDFRMRIIPNELVLLLLIISLVFRLLEWNLPHLLSHFIGLVLVLLLFLVAALLTGKGSVGEGDLKLAMVIGFTAAFPNALYAVLAMSLSMGLFGIVGILLKKLHAKSKLPLAVFLMFGSIVAKLMELY